jgi:hypothetical protein
MFDERFSRNHCSLVRRALTVEINALFWKAQRVRRRPREVEEAAADRGRFLSSQRRPWQLLKRHSRTARSPFKMAVIVDRLKEELSVVAQGKGIRSGRRRTRKSGTNPTNESQRRQRISARSANGKETEHRGVSAERKKGTVYGRRKKPARTRFTTPTKVTGKNNEPLFRATCLINEISETQCDNKSRSQMVLRVHPDGAMARWWKMVVASET